jgi:predicted ArsR family transcriptional regulator
LARTVRPSELEREIAAIASLHDPVRRGLYRYVRARRRDVSRDEAARALRISRNLAAFHLDKLVAHNLLDTTFRRLSGRQGPGAGRPAKLYHCSNRQLDFTLPPRRYALAGGLLALAIATARSPGGARALQRVAARLGRQTGSAARRRGGRSGGKRRAVASVVEVLDAWGYEPAVPNETILLENCPFDAVAKACQPLVCDMNLALLRGVLQGAGARTMTAELRPRPRACCVVLARRTR